jgi:Protein of unknown function (DUF3830)
MDPKRRQIRLTYVNTGESILAEMLDDEAPGICDHIWSILPVEHKVLHGMYSGAEVFAMLDNPQPVKPENLVQLPLPGELLYFYDPSTGAVGSKKPVAEICIVYGRGVVLRAHEGVPIHCSLFARIPGDWKYAWKDFAQACRKARWEGPQLLRIERVEK